MGEGRSSIEAISIHFVSGVAISALAPWKGMALYRAAAVICPVLGILCVLMCGRGRRRGATFAAFVAAGMLCHVTSSICGGGDGLVFPAAARALERLCGLIDSIAFRHEDTGALVKALLTGERSTLERATVESFRKAGAAHILALSGLHLGVIYGIVGKILSAAGNSRPAAVLRSAVCVAFCAFYTLMTGAGASTVRALIFITVREILRHDPQRRHGGTDTLCTALTVHLLLRPADVESLGFQLSYLAMLGIFEIAPQLRRFWPEGGGRADVMRRIWDCAAVSIACQAPTAPLLYLRLHTLPGHFLLTNLLALPLTEALILCSVAGVALQAAGFGGTIAESLSDFLAQALIFALKVISEM